MFRLRCIMEKKAAPVMLFIDGTRPHRREDPEEIN